MTINEDLGLYNKLRTTPNAQSDFLHQKYYRSNLYKYQIICYILRRYFNDIENNIRYPTKENGYSINNPFNNAENKGSIRTLSQITRELIYIITNISTQLLKEVRNQTV